MERAIRAPRKEHAEDLDTVLETGGVLTRLWHDIAGQREIPDWFRDALILERRARKIREYESTVVPGLLQTPAYARTLIRERRFSATPEQIEQDVQTRTERLPTLREGGVPSVWFVVKESVLMDVVGGEALMREQLGHIVKLVDGDGSIRIQVLPSSPSTIGMCLPFRVFAFNETQSVAYMENNLGGTVFDSPAQVEEMTTLFEHLQAEALSPAESLRLIREIMESRYGEVD